MGVDTAFNFRRVSDLVSTAGLLDEAQLRLLAGEGYVAVLNLLPHDSEYAIANEEAMVTAQGVAYEYIPVDFAAPAESDYDAFAAALVRHAGEKLMLHCAANYRVSAFYSIYAYRNLGWTQAQVDELICSLWNVAEYPVWQAFLARMLETSRD